MSGNLVLFPSARTEYVVDSWAVMEWLKRRQPAALLFRRLIERANEGDIVLWMSMVNLGEVYYTSRKEWGLEQAEGVLERVIALPIKSVSVSDDQVFAAARLKSIYKISYADAFGASLAISKSCALVTGDQEFRSLEQAGILRLEWLGA